MAEEIPPPEYWDPEWDDYVPPDGAVSYSYGTWRWRFGAFSARRGWPSCGVIWNERLALFKEASGYLSVAGDLKNFAERNELGEITADMAFSFTLKDPNGIRAAIADEKLLLLTASGMWALGPSNAAQGVGPGNFRVDPQNNEGSAATMPVEIDGRFVYIGKSRRKVVEAALEAQRNRQAPIDLSRYARHIGGQSRFADVVAQKDPNTLVWTHRDDGTLALATYVPDEQVLGWARRPMAAGVLAGSIAGITDPDGELGQVWIAAEMDGDWHVLRMAQFRQEGDTADPVMLDMAWEFSGAASTTWGPVPWLAGKTCQVQADGVGGAESAAYSGIVVDEDGMFTLSNAHAAGAIGLPYECRVAPLPPVPGDASGSSLGKMRRASRIAIDVLKARGLRLKLADGTVLPFEQLQSDSRANEGFAPDTGILIKEDAGDWNRATDISIERYLPHGATVRAFQPTVDVSPA
jgi:hypothetical protein